jgi:hypothetical protein
VALAWYLTAGDERFVEWVRTNREFDAPVALAGCLADVMADVGCILRSPRTSFGPSLAVIAKPYHGPFQQLAVDFDTERLPQLIELRGSDVVRDWPPSHMRAAKPFKLHCLREFLEGRAYEVWVQIRGRIQRGEIRARGVPVDRGNEGPAGELLPSAITEEMVIDPLDGMLHQNANKTARAWRLVTVAWSDFMRSFGTYPKRRGGGAPPTYDWETIEAKAYHHFDAEGFERQADIEKYITELAVQKHGREPSASIARSHAKNVLEKLKNRKADN